MLYIVELRHAVGELNHELRRRDGRDVMYLVKHSSSIETGQFSPTAKLALVICIALDKQFEELLYF